MAKEKQQIDELVEFNFPAEGVTVKAKDLADAQAKLTDILKANK